MRKFLFNYKIQGEEEPDTAEIGAETLSDAVNLFLEGQYPDGELERTCETIESFSVQRA